MDHEKWPEQHDRMMADQAEAIARHEKTMAAIDRRLDRAIRLAVQDARRQRARNLEFEQLMAKLAVSQLALQEMLLKRGGNGQY